MDAEELTLIELNDVQGRWAENGNPALSGMSGEMPLVGPWGVNIVIEPNPRVDDPYRLTQTKAACESIWDNPDHLRQCIEVTHRIETMLWRDEITVAEAKRLIDKERRVAPKPPAPIPIPGRPGGDLKDLLLGPVGAFMIAGLSILGILALSRRR